VPTISSFYGIAIRMFFGDHPPPHFHVVYAGYEARIEIETGEILDGKLPPRAAGLVREWAAMHRDELNSNWSRAERSEPLRPIQPLP